MTPPALRVEDRGPVRVLTLDNPGRRNALDEGILEALAEALADASSAHVRALLVRGAGGAFCSGYDLSALPPPGPDGSLPDDRLGEVLAMFASHPAPSVALVEGPAFGAGCELAASCDFRIGAPSAVFSMPPAKLGIVYAPEGLARLVSLVGLSRAKRMFFTGMRLDSDTAYAWGLLDERAPDPGAAEAQALALCEAIAQNAPGAVAGMKRAFAALSAPRLEEAERSALRALRRAAFLSEDAKEGRAAFLQKRAPRFSGR